MCESKVSDILEYERKVKKCMRKIRRTFNWSKCYGQRYNFDTKEYEDFSFEVLGNYTEKRATNYARQKFKDSSILITNVEINSEVFAISPEDFIKYGERIK